MQRWKRKLRPLRSKLQPNPELRLQRCAVGGGERADGMDDEPVFNRRNLRLDSAAYVQPGGTSVLQDQIDIRELRGNRNDEQISCVAAVTDDDRRADLAARQVGERNREKNNLIS